MMHKKLCIGLTTAALLAFSGSAALAAPNVIVDGMPLTLDQPPIIVDSRTLVPMRAIFEALGCDVTWYTDTKTVIARKDLDALSLTIGDKTLYANQNITLDVPAQIINGRTMVPLRVVSEALHAQVVWDAATETVTITAPAQGQYAYTTAHYTNQQGNATVDMAYPQFISQAGLDETVRKNLNQQLAATARTHADAFFADSKEMGELPDITYTAQERFAISYNKNNVVSILSQNVIDYHGAHPTTVRNSVVYDMTTGKALALTDLLNGSQTEIDQRILDGFIKQIDAQPEAYFGEAKDALAKGIANTTYDYYLKENGLAFYFQLYELAPYAAGFSEYTLSFDQSDAFQKKL